MSNKTALSVLSILFLLFILTFNGFIFNGINVGIDTAAHYSFFKYFFNNLFNGTFVLWEPSVFLGRSHINAPFSGFLNPLALCCGFLGFLINNYYIAYLIFILSIVLLSTIGFYLLCRFYFEEHLSLFASALLLFSGVFASIFNQIYMVLVFFPLVWSVFFLISFTRNNRILRDFWGFTLAIISMHSFYIPFYGYTFYLIFLPLVAIFYRPILRVFFKKLMMLPCKQVFLGILLIFASIIPFLLFSQHKNQSDFFSPSRNTIDSANGRIVDLGKNFMTAKEAGGMGPLGQRIVGGRLFSGLDTFSYSSDDFFYLPALCYFFIVVGLFVFIDKRILFMGILCLGLISIAFGNASIIYDYFYKFIFYAKQFRNLFFFMVIIMPIIILLSISHLRNLLEYAVNKRAYATAKVILSVFIVIGLMIFHHNGVVASYVSIILAAVLLIMFFNKKINSRFLLLALAFTALIEPLNVFAIYQKNALIFRERPLPSAHKQFHFSFTRPEATYRPDSNFKAYTYRKYNHYYYNLTLEDSSGFLSFFPDWCSKYVYELGMNIKISQSYYQYTHTKFRAYSKVVFLSERESQLRLSDDLKNSFNDEAIIIDAPQNAQYFDLKGDGASKGIINEQDGIHIDKFNANMISFTTHFNTNTFLVYNDAYSKFWTVYRNNIQETLYRANYAFKGFYVPKGEQHFSLIYKPIGSIYIYVIPFTASLICLLFLLLNIKVNARESV